MRRRVGLLSVALGHLFARRHMHFMRLVTSRGPGGVALRRLGVLTAFVGPLLGALFMAVMRKTGLTDEPLMVALAVVLGVAYTLGVVAFTARSLERTHGSFEDARERVNQLLEQAPDGVFVADLDGRYVDVNIAACRMLGYARDELLGKTIVDLIPPEDVPRLWASRESMREGATHEGRWLLLRKNGSGVPVDIRARILADGQWQAIVRDVSDRVRLEHELACRLVEHELLARVGVDLAECLTAREVFDATQRLVLGHLGDLCIIDLVRGDTLERISVRHADEGKQALAAQLKRVLPVAQHQGPWWHVLDTRQALQLCDGDGFRYAADCTKTAELFAALELSSLTIVPMMARGQLLAVLTVASSGAQGGEAAAPTHVVEEVARRAALALDNVQLYQQSRLQAALTTNLAEGVVLVRPSDGSIVYANPRFEEIFGYGPGELVGQHVHVLNAPHREPPEHTAASILGALDRHGRWHGEVHNITKQGKPFWCHVSISVFEHEELGRVWVGAHLDVDERKRLELENACALVEKEALLREIHHRVKNNLQVVSSLFSLQRARTDNEILRALLDESRSRVQSIALVHEHLYQSVSLAAVDLEPYLRRLVESIRSTYGDGRIDVQVRAAGVVLSSEQAVPFGLLTGELVSNAFRHAFPNGRRGRISIDAHDGPCGECVLEVADDGCGMPSGVDSHDAKSLGLRLVRIFVKQLHGSLEIDRSQGTRFVIRFRPDEVTHGEPPPAAHVQA